MMADVIQSAGYFPDPTSQHSNLGTHCHRRRSRSGQSITGSLRRQPPPAIQISVRYMTAGGDGILNCSGLSNPTGGPNTLYVNTFQVVNGQLVCTMNGTQYNLVSGAPWPTNLSVTI